MSPIHPFLLPSHSPQVTAGQVEGLVNDVTNLAFADVPLLERGPDYPIPPSIPQAVSLLSQ